MRAFAILAVIMLMPLTSALSDLTVYSEAKYTSQDDAPILVEWFHGEDDEDQLEELTKMDREGEITLFIGELEQKKREEAYQLTMLMQE